MSFFENDLKLNQKKKTPIIKILMVPSVFSGIDSVTTDTFLKYKIHFNNFNSKNHH